MSQSVLIDSNFLIALYKPKDKFHAHVVNFIAQNPSLKIIIPEVVLVEVIYELKGSSGHRIAQNFLQDMLNNQPIVIFAHLDRGGLQTAYRIHEQYPQFDFVDACVIALSERLDIRSICTFDRRDFAQYRPSKWEYLELLPE